MYNIELHMANNEGYVTHKEYVKYYSLWAARNWCRDLIKCKDIAEALIIDEDTGEIMLHLTDNGVVVWDSEG